MAQFWHPTGLLDKPVTVVQPDRVPAEVRARIVAVTRCSPPRETGLSHWSSRELSGFLKHTEKISVSHNYIATLWREHGLKPWQVGTFKLSRDPAFAEKVAAIVGLYLEPPGGAVVLSIDEKTQVQALDRTQPTLPLDCGKVEKKTHDYIRHDKPVRRAERGDRGGVRRVLPDPHWAGLPQLPQ